MKLVMIIAVMLMGAQAFAGDYTPNKWASASTVADWQANPNYYKVDDGGNIDFGNGIFKRRFNFKGQAQVCHASNYLYAGTGSKCVKWEEDDGHNECVAYKTVELVTLMTGKVKTCKDLDSDDNGYTGPGSQKCWTINVNRGPVVKVALVRKASGQFKGFMNLTIPACE